MRLDYARSSYHNEFTDFPHHSYSRAPPQHFFSCCLVSFMDITIAHMVLVHERTALCLDILVTAHVLIVVIISHVGMVFLLEGLTSALSLDTLMVHIFPIAVHVSLVQRVRCKRLLRPPQVAWLHGRFLRFISLTPALGRRPLLVLCG
jgi:hypothetical protein